MRDGRFLGGGAALTLLELDRLGVVRRVLQQFNLCHHVNAVAARVLGKLIAFEGYRHRLCAHQLLTAVVYTDNRELKWLAGGLE